MFCARFGGRRDRLSFQQVVSKAAAAAPRLKKGAVSSAFREALFRTRTGDPLLTMEVLYQLS